MLPEDLRGAPGAVAQGGEHTKGRREKCVIWTENGSLLILRYLRARVLKHSEF